MNMKPGTLFMLNKVIAFFFLTVLISFSVHATKTYDFSTRITSDNVFAYAGINSSALPTNNTFPSDEHDTSEYSVISENDGSLNTVSTNQNNNYPMFRYVFELDEAETDINQLTFLWNGSGTNDNNGKNDGAVLYLWNYNNSNYDQIATSGDTSSEVDLTYTLTVDIIDYIDENNNNALTLLVVSNDGANGNKDNEISADYVSIEANSSVLEPLAEYRFEETNWSGSSTPILDSTGNGYHGKVDNNSVPEVTLPALSGDPGTCGYASQNDGSIQVTNLPLDTSTAGIKTTVTFWMNWDGTENSMPIGWTTHDIWLINGSMGFNTGSGDVYGISSAGLANGWHHVTVEFTNGSVTDNKMYIDGEEQTLTQRRNSPNNNRAFVGSELRIGGWTNDRNYDFNGLIDEVRVYESALTTDQITTIMDERHPCPIPDATPILEYRFDELSWNGDNYVFDNSGNINNGSLIGDITSVVGKICSAANIPLNNNASTIDAIDTEIDFDTIVGSSGTISLWYNGDSDWETGVDRRLFDANDGDKYFFAEITSDGRVKFWFEDGNDGDYQKSTDSAFPVNAGEWKHLTFVWDIPSSTAKIFVDGLEQNISGGSGGTTTFTGFDTLYFGDNRDASYITGQSSADGIIDEVLVFDSVLTSTQIEEIFTHQDTGNNYDGSLRACPTPAILLLEYRFEEESWNGSSDEIIDDSGNGYHAQVNNNSTPVTTSPALFESPGTCGYADQNDGSIQVTGLPLDTTSVGVKTTVTFWMNWDGTDNVMPLGWNLHDIWIRNGSMGFNTFRSDIYGISSSDLANEWHHIAVEFTNGNITDNRMHIDGVEQVLTQRFGTPNNNNAFVNSQMRVGGVSNSTGYDFHGLLDEFRVYESALTTVQIQIIMAERHPCDAQVIDHYQIIHDGQGLTCDAETITIKACTNTYDGSCTLSDEPVTLNVNTTGSASSTDSISFTGTGIASIPYTIAESTTLSIDNVSIVADNSVVCFDGSNNDCNLLFADAGFRFLNGSSGSSEVITNQIAGTSFPLRIEAVQNNNGVCEGLFTGNKNVNLSQENIDPSGIDGLSFSINGNDIEKYTDGVTSTTLNFETVSFATFPTPIYHDAGQIRLHANYDTGGVTLTGSSNSFWVSPAELVISAKSGATNLDGASSASTTTYVAGEDFDLTVTAYNSLGVITPNYSPGQIQLKLERTGPTINGADGELTYGSGGFITSTLAAATPAFDNVTLDSTIIDGVLGSSDAHYSEVGLLNLDVQDNNYGNVNIIVSATDINIGRFIPDHFRQTMLDDGAFKVGLIAGTTFAYSGQKDESTGLIGAISYLTPPVLEITAYNSQNEITQNYIDDFAKLREAKTSSNLLDGVFFDTISTTHVNTLEVTGDISTLGDYGDGSAYGKITYTLASDHHFTYTRNSLSIVSPFDAALELPIASIQDSDNVQLKPEDTNIYFSNPSFSSDLLNTVEIRFGRLVLENSFGSETSDLAQPMQLEHFNGTDFIVTSDNDYVSFDATKIALANISLDPSFTDVLGGTGNFFSGKTRDIELEAPGTRGKIGVTYNIYDWLEYDWPTSGTGDQTFDDDPTAEATFGVFRGNDRIISWREVGN
jgi:MSHA biogenesis protein MshQ